MPGKIIFVPVTPGGTPCGWLASNTEAQAWAKLLKDAAHMPYRGVDGFKKRGYMVEQFEEKPSVIANPRDKV